MRQSGNIVYEVPPGYEVDELTLGPTDVPVTVIRHEDWLDVDMPELRLLRGETVAGDDATLRRWAEARLPALLDTFDRETLAIDSWQPLGQVNGAQVSLGLGLVSEDGRPARAFGAFLIRVDDRAEIALTEVDADEAAAPGHGLSASIDMAAGLIEDFGYVTAGAAPLIGSPVPGPLDGVWFGTTMTLVPQVGGMLGTQIYSYVYVFTPDGRFYEDIPPGGIGRLVDPDLRLDRTESTGNYQVVGDGIVLSFADGRVEDAEIEGDTILSHGASMFRVGVLPAGTTLDATYSSMTYTPLATGVGSTGGAMAASDIRFTPDGRFVREGTSSVGGPGFHVGGETREGGRYEANPGELALFYDDGTIRRWEALVLQDEGEAPALRLGGDFADLAPGYRLPPAVEHVSALIGGTPVAQAAQGAVPANPLGGEANPLAAAANPPAPAANPLAARAPDAAANLLAPQGAADPTNPLSR